MILRIPGNILLAFTTLTRLPLPTPREVDEARLREAAVWYPVVGFALGLAWFGLALAGLVLHLPPGLVAAVVLAMGYLLNGFLHFDGFCDCCDACLPLKDRATRLAILKDSHVGSFALGGGILLILLRWQLVTAILDIAHRPGQAGDAVMGVAALLVLVPVVARWVILPLAFKARYPRQDGTASFMVGRLSAFQFLVGTMVMLAILGSWRMFDTHALSCRAVSEPVAFLGLYAGASSGALVEALFRALLLVVAAVVTAAGVRFYANGKLGGITGDVLGAAVELTETAMLAALLLTLP